MNSTGCPDAAVGDPASAPDAAAVVAASQALSLAEEAQDGEVLLVLISGGGSALLPLPAESLTLEDKLDATRMLAAAGYAHLSAMLPADLRDVRCNE